MMKHWLCVGAVTLLILPASAAPRDNVLAADTAFSALSVAKGSNAAFIAYLSDDGRIFGTGSEAPIIGKAEALRRFAKSGNGDPKTNVLSWVVDHADVATDQTLGATDGHWRFEGARDAKGKRLTLTGHYVTVWRKVRGSWKVLADIGTTDPAAKK